MYTKIIQHISLSKHNVVENMGKVTIRTGLTSQGFIALSPWKGDNSIYEYSAINLGNNPNSLIEIVSALNSFNLTWDQYHFNAYNCLSKYNPKVYIGAVQSVAFEWNFDNNSGLLNLPNLPLGDPQKSGSWPQIKVIFISNIA